MTMTEIVVQLSDTASSRAALASAAAQARRTGANLRAVHFVDLDATTLAFGHLANSKCTTPLAEMVSHAQGLYGAVAPRPAWRLEFTIRPEVRVLGDDV